LLLFLTSRAGRARHGEQATGICIDATRAMSGVTGGAGVRGEMLRWRDANLTSPRAAHDVACRHKEARALDFGCPLRVFCACSLLSHAPRVGEETREDMGNRATRLTRAGGGGTADLPAQADARHRDMMAIFQRQGVEASWRHGHACFTLLSSAHADNELTPALLRRRRRLAIRNSRSVRLGYRMLAPAGAHT